jgi:hypothetical protein
MSYTDEPSNLQEWHMQMALSILTQGGTPPGILAGGSPNHRHKEHRALSHSWLIYLWARLASLGQIRTFKNPAK